MANGFIEVSGYSSTDLQNKYNEGYGVGYEDGRDSMEFKSKTITNNGTYRASDDDCDGYDEVEVNVAGNVGVKDITANGDYKASDDGFTGYSKVFVNVPGGGGGGPYTVRFYGSDRTTILETQVVQYGGGAVYHGATPTTPGMRFVGWSPNPIGVTSNMNCYPRFENLIYDPTQILDDWLTIAQNIRRNPDAYNIGQWKLLELNGNIDGIWRTQTNLVPVEMVLVAKGVDPLEGQNGYAPTTWVARSLISNRFGDGQQQAGRVCWDNCNLRRFFQTEFTQYAFPPELLNYVRRVIKYSTVYDGAQRINSYPTIDWFWIPSFREVFGNNGEDLTAKTIYSGNHYFGVRADLVKETTGAIYDIFGSTGKSTLEDQYQNIHFKNSQGGYNNQEISLRSWGTWDAYAPIMTVSLSQKADGSRPNEINFIGNTALRGDGVSGSWGAGNDIILLGFCL